MTLWNFHSVTFPLHGHALGLRRRHEVNVDTKRLQLSVASVLATLLIGQVVLGFLAEV